MAAKRATVFVLAVGLAGLGIYGWLSGTATPQVLGLIAFGVVLSILFLVGGAMPSFVHRYGGVARDDDPGNIPPRIYLPILGLVLLAAAVIFWTLRR